MAYRSRHRQKLTQALVKKVRKEQLQACEDAAGRRLPDRYIWDSESPLGLRLHGTGGASWVLKPYAVQMAGRREPRRHTFGLVSDVTLEDAQDRARDLWGRYLDGEDPVGEIQQRKLLARQGRASDPTVGDLAERYMKEVAASNKPATRREKQRGWDQVVRLIGERQVAKVDAEDIEFVLRSIGDGKPVWANRVRSLLSHAFNVCSRWRTVEGERWRELNANPVLETDPNRERGKGRTYSDVELRAIWTALGRLEGQDEIDWVLAILIRILIYTGARPGEPASARWSNWDPTKQLIWLEESKADRGVALGRRIYLPTQVLEWVPYLGAAQSEFMFPRRKLNASWRQERQKDASVTKTAWRKTWQKVAEEAGLVETAGVAPQLRHLRNTWISMAQQAGIKQAEAGWMAGHRPRGMTAHYTAQPDEYWLEQAEIAGDFIRKAIGAQPLSASSSGSGRAAVITFKPGITRPLSGI